jgi:hypothetical protein
MGTATEGLVQQHLKVISGIILRKIICVKRKIQHGISICGESR